MKIIPDKLLKPRWLLPALCAWWALAVAVMAQTPSPLPPLPSLQPPAAAEGPQPNIAKISIVVQGPQQISEDAILAHLSIREGMTFDAAQLERSYDSLMETGLYDDIQTSRESIDANNVRVIITLTPNDRISAVVFDGNKAYKRERLAEEIKTIAGGVLNHNQLNQDKTKLFDFYQKSGYSRVKVTYTVDSNASTGTAVVTFHIDEGPDVVIENIQFAGNDHVAAGKLLDQMDTTTYHWLYSWLTKGGRLQEDTFAEDLVKVRQYYKDLGYLDVEIDDNEVKYDYPNPDQLNITIQIHEGIQYHLGAITISGNTIFQSDTLKKQLKLKSGDIFSPDKVDKDAQALQDRYGQSGYLQTIVAPVRKPNLATGNMDLDFHITESQKFYVESINIDGNVYTKSTVIVRELALAPGDVFDTVRMKTSENRLKNTRFFGQVHLDSEDTTIPGKSNLRITVEEGKTQESKTGSLSVTLGFDSVDKAVLSFTAEQDNFDLFNYRTFFRGAGEKAKITISVGSYEKNVVLTFEEPWLWERELAGGFNIFDSESNYSGATYNQVDLGFDVYLRKRIIELIEGTLTYTLENIEIKDVSSNAPPQIMQEQGNASVSKIDFGLLRDTRDSFLFPKSGTRLELINEVAGGPLMGQTDYYKLEGRAGGWWPTFSFGDQVVSLVGRAGSIIGYDGKPVPYAERYFLGGQDNLRGYAYRNVGPRVEAPGSLAYGQPTGGNSFVYVSPEYSIEIINPVRFAVFYDFGYLNSAGYDFGPNDYRQDVGVGFRILILGAPLRLDLGYPLNADIFQSHSVQLNVAFGVTF